MNSNEKVVASTYERVISSLMGILVDAPGASRCTTTQITPSILAQYTHPHAGRALRRSQRKLEGRGKAVPEGVDDDYTDG